MGRIDSYLFLATTALMVLLALEVTPAKASPIFFKDPKQGELGTESKGVTLRFGQPPQVNYFLRLPIKFQFGTTFFSTKDLSTVR